MQRYEAVLSMSTHLSGLNVYILVSLVSGIADRGLTTPTVNPDVSFNHSAPEKITSLPRILSLYMAPYTIWFPQQRMTHSLWSFWQNETFSRLFELFIFRVHVRLVQFACLLFQKKAGFQGHLSFFIRYCKQHGYGFLRWRTFLRLVQ